jgi:hypothetical protein
MSTIDGANRQKVHTSATVLLKIQNKDGQYKTIGVGQNATATENWNLIAVNTGFGSIMPLEHVVTEWNCTVTLEKFYLRSNSLAELGIASTGAGILTMPPIDIQFLDIESGKPGLTTFKSCTLQSREFTVTQNAVVGERATWLALDVLNTLPNKASSQPGDYAGQ